MQHGAWGIDVAVISIEAFSSSGPCNTNGVPFANWSLNSSHTIEKWNIKLLISVQVLNINDGGFIPRHKNWSGKWEQD